MNDLPARADLVAGALCNAVSASDAATGIRGNPAEAAKAHAAAAHALARVAELLPAEPAGATSGPETPKENP